MAEPKPRLIEFESPEDAINFHREFYENELSGELNFEPSTANSSRLVYIGTDWKRVKKLCNGAQVSLAKTVVEALNFVRGCRLDDLHRESEESPQPPALQHKALVAWQKSQEQVQLALDEVERCNAEISRLRVEKHKALGEVNKRRLYVYETSAEMVRAFGRVPIEHDGRLHYPSSRGRRIFYIPGKEGGLKDG